MGFIGKLIDRIKENKERSEFERQDDDRTDSYLLSLRKMRQKQLDEMERSQLQRVTTEYERSRVRKGLYGYKDGSVRRKPVIGQPKPILKAKNMHTMGPSRGKKIGGRNRGRRGNGGGFLGRHPL